MDLNAIIVDTQVNKMKEKLTVFIGDIHGCLEELDELLKTLSYNKDNMRLVLVGDLIDRGPDSVGVVRRAREIELESIMGNHEYKFLRWFKGNKHLDCPEYYSKFSDEDITYINNMPYYLKFDENLCVVHAGIKPFIPIDKQRKDDLLYLRFTDKDRKFISLKKIAKGESEGAMFWTEFGPFDSNVIYGHHVHSMESIRIDKFSDETACYGIDTGCCFGGALSAFIWETKEVIQVKAKREYYKSGF